MGATWGLRAGAASNESSSSSEGEVEDVVKLLMVVGVEGVDLVGMEVMGGE